MGDMLYSDSPIVSMAQCLEAVASKYTLLGNTYTSIIQGEGFFALQYT